ncbi:zinc-binding dehydrogenase [Nonomuraea angiospora]|uniref:zinc-binding dehydrogenase n=1 Tax=Nonomuraea angiospora TaxID=46172 RepID=UPI003435EEC9
MILTEPIDEGKIAPVIDRTYPCGEIPAAPRCAEQGHASEKIVITVWFTCP